MGEGFVVNDYADYPTTIRRRKKRKPTVPAWQSLSCFLLVCFAVAALGAHFTSPEVHSWYAHLVKPRFTPPNWLFTTIWIILYAMMGVAAWLVWRNGRRAQRI